MNMTTEGNKKQKQKYFFRFICIFPSLIVRVLNDGK